MFLLKKCAVFSTKKCLSLRRKFMWPFLHLLSALVLWILGRCLNEKSYFTLNLSAHRPVTFVGVFDAPFELADEANVKRVEDFYECQVMNTYHNCHQRTNISNGARTFSVVLNRHLRIPATVPYDLSVFKIVCFTEISRKFEKVCSRWLKKINLNRLYNKYWWAFLTIF